MGLAIVTLKEGDYQLLYPKDFREDGTEVPEADQIKLFLHYLSQTEREMLAEVEMKFAPGSAGKSEERRDVSVKANTIRDTNKRLQLGLVGWENAKGEDGKPIKFDKRFVPKINYIKFTTEDGRTKKFPFKDDLDKHIAEVNGLGAEEAGK